MSIIKFLPKIISIWWILIYILTVFTYPSNALDEIENFENEVVISDIRLTPILFQNAININESASVTFESNDEVIYDRMKTGESHQ